MEMVQTQEEQEAPSHLDNEPISKGGKVTLCLKTGSFPRTVELDYKRESAAHSKCVDTSS